MVAWPVDVTDNAHSLHSTKKQTETANSIFLFVFSSKSCGFTTTMPKHDATNCVAWSLIFDVAKPRGGLKEKQHRRRECDGA
jgi:hypothetical protein